MRPALGALMVASLTTLSCGPARPPNPIDGQRAHAHVAAMVALGPRPPMSEAHRKCREYIVGELRKIGLEPRTDSFRDQENAPGFEFHNIEAEIPGSRAGEERVLVLGAHYDTKNADVADSPDRTMKFVGANDAGSGSGLLIELARHFRANPLPCRLLCVWFDGEESIPWTWADKQALFGSRRTVRSLRARFPKERFPNLNQAVPAMVLLDMVGNKDLDITEDTASTPDLIEIFREASRELRYERSFFRVKKPVTDDHTPFLDFGIKAIDIIQFGEEYGEPEWWHNAGDDISLISAESLGIVGHVVTLALPRIAERFYPSREK